MRVVSTILAILVPLALSGCGEPPLDGFEWTVTLTGTEDLCNAEPVGYQETMTYRLDFVEGESGRVDVAIGPDVFASGGIEGCRIDYQSVVYQDERDGYPVRWFLTGTGYYHQGFGCETQLPDNIDWKTTEVIEIVETEHPDIPIGCTYTLDVEGSYVGEAGK